MRSFRRSVAFPFAVSITAFVIVVEVLVFAVLYWSTVAVYEDRANNAIHQSAERLLIELAQLPEAEMKKLVNQLCNDVPGEFDEYMLATKDGKYLAASDRARAK